MYLIIQNRHTGTILSNRRVKATADKSERSWPMVREHIEALFPVDTYAIIPPITSIPAADRGRVTHLTVWWSRTPDGKSRCTPFDGWVVVKRAETKEEKEPKS